jgi:WG containing repeat
MAIIVIFLIPILIILGIWLQVDREYKIDLENTDRLLKRSNPQKYLRSKFKTDDVYIYLRGLWIVRVKSQQEIMHYLVEDNGDVKAKTDINGFIYAMYKCHKLFIQVDDDSSPRQHAWRPNHLHGAVDDNLKIIIPVIYEKLDALEEDFIIAVKAGRSGVYNPLNLLIVPVKYDSIFQDVHGKYIIGIQKDVHDLYNYDGKLLKSMYYSKVYPNSINRISRAKIFIIFPDVLYDEKIDSQLLRGNWGLLDSSYEELIPPTYDLLYDGPHSVMVMQGSLTIEPSDNLWPGMQSFYLGSGGKWGVRGFDNQPILPIVYDWLDFTPHKDLFLFNNGGKMAFIKTANQPGFWTVIGGKWGLIDKNSQIMVKPDYDKIQIHQDKILFQHSELMVFNEQIDFLTYSL